MEPRRSKMAEISGALKNLNIENLKKELAGEDIDELPGFTEDTIRNLLLNLKAEIERIQEEMKEGLPPEKLEKKDLRISVGTNACFSLKANGYFGSARTLISESVERLNQHLALSVKTLEPVKDVFSFSARNHNYYPTQFV